MSAAGFLHDANHVPLTQYGFLNVDSQTLVGSGATVDVPIFGITGQVQVNALWAVVTTALGNNTAAAFRLNDGTAQSDITLATGTTLTAAPVGSLLVRRQSAGSAVTLLSASQEQIQDPATSTSFTFIQFVAVQKTGAVTTNIEFVYTTSDTPTTGALTFYLGWYPLVPGSNVTSL